MGQGVIQTIPHLLSTLSPGGRCRIATEGAVTQNIPNYRSSHPMGELARGLRGRNPENLLNPLILKILIQTGLTKSAKPAPVKH